MERGQSVYQVLFNLDFGLNSQQPTNLVYFLMVVNTTQQNLLGAVDQRQQLSTSLPHLMHCLHALLGH